MHELREDGKALRHLKEGRKIGREINYRYAEFIALLTDAQFAFDRGKEVAGFSALSEALALGRECGYMNTHTLPPRSMARLSLKALQTGIETKYIQELIKKRNLIPESLSHDVEDWPWQVKAYTLGRFSFVRDGKTILFPKKAQSRPLDLLKTIIALGGRDVGQGQIIDILWPEVDGDKAQKALKITLHRLRCLAGNPNSINFRDGKVSLDSQYWWVDTWAFERHLGRAEADLKDGHKGESISSFQKAVALYRGEFLAGDHAIPKIASQGNKLRSKFLRGVNNLGRLFEEKGKFDQAIDTYKQGIETDVVAEELYQHLMICYQRLGRKAEAIEVYSRLKKTLHSHHGVAPSPETEAIYRSVLRG
jgi:DNA-binding SARP family transcriptional activator